MNLDAVNGDGQVRRVHAVLVCPQLGAGVLTISETVDSDVVNGQGVGAAGRHHNGDILVGRVLNTIIQRLLCAGNHTGALDHGVPGILTVLLGDHGVAGSNEVGVLTLGLAVGGVEVHESTAGDDDLGSARLAVGIVAVQVEIAIAVLRGGTHGSRPTGRAR